MDPFTIIVALLKLASDSLMSIFINWGLSENAARLLIYFLGLLLLIALIKLLEFIIIKSERDKLPPPWDNMGQW
jgi:hypothetical protein